MDATDNRFEGESVGTTPSRTHNVAGGPREEVPPNRTRAHFLKHGRTDRYQPPTGPCIARPCVLEAVDEGGLQAGTTL